MNGTQLRDALSVVLPSPYKVSATLAYQGATVGLCTRVRDLVIALAHSQSGWEAWLEVSRHCGTPANMKIRAVLPPGSGSTSICAGARLSSPIAVNDRDMNSVRASLEPLFKLVDSAR